MDLRSLTMVNLRSQFGEEYPYDFYATFVDMTTERREQIGEEIRYTYKTFVDDIYEGDESKALRKLLDMYYGSYQDIRETLPRILEGEVPLYRGISFNGYECDVERAVKETDLNNVGESWALRRESAMEFGECIIEAKRPTNIDEKLTTMLNTMYGKDPLGESEIRLKEGASIDLVMVCPQVYEDESECKNFPKNTLGKV